MVQEGAAADGEHQEDLALVAACAGDVDLEDVPAHAVRGLVRRALPREVAEVLRGVRVRV